uniref:Uncharacterized protein n=1 Tax=Gasterosteus aculeatus TaxID=69293 RepID=G3Q9Q2_GASAC
MPVCSGTSIGSILVLRVVRPVASVGGGVLSGIQLPEPGLLLCHSNLFFLSFPKHILTNYSTIDTCCCPHTRS